MASRRTRLKAVINLPVRRAREGDNSSTSVGDKHVTESPQTKETTTKLPKEVTEVIDSNKCNENPKTSACRPANKPTIIETKENVRATEEEDNVNKKATEPSIPEQSSDQNIPGHSKIELLPPPKLTIPVRKRVKPVVSLAALTRKPKEICLEIEKTKDNDAKSVKENGQTSSLREQPSEHDVDIQKTSSTKHLASVDNVQEDDASGPLPSSKNAQSPSKLHRPTDNAKLSSPTKVLSKPKFGKLTPRLIDSSKRRQSNQVDVEDPLKAVPSFSQRADITTHLTPTDTRQTVPDTDDEFETSSLYSCTTTHITQPSGKKVTTAPSVTSTVYEDHLELADDGQPSKAEKRPQTHRRPRKSGVGEILSVARRDFYKKFGSSTPDKKQLTMFDLIFYNPTSNPMRNVSKEKGADKVPGTESKPADLVAERIAEESVDDVATLDDEEISATPAPQVKVGPDGSLIIDEKSLVIATTGSQKRKEELANSSVVVDYGLGNATYNSFSKKVKPKDWSKQETLKFYRALQAVGTDFLLMKSIFPARTRGDLKQKYKKEDRLNRDLIDKALRNPLEFDLTALEQELEQERKENEEKEKRRLEELEKNENMREENERKLLLRKQGAIASALLDDLPIGLNKPHQTNPNNKRKREEKPGDANGAAKKPAKRRRRRRRIASESLSSTDEEDGDINLEVHLDNACETINKREDGNETLAERNKTSAERNETSAEIDEEEEEDREASFLERSPRPTRYGRVPRPRSASFGVSTNPDRAEGDSEENGRQAAFKVPTLENVEPGSLVILSTPGQKTLQLFMVAPKSRNSPQLTHVPVAVTPEILASVSGSIGSPTAGIDYLATDKDSVSISLNIDT